MALKKHRTQLYFVIPSGLFGIAFGAFLMIYGWTLNSSREAFISSGALFLGLGFGVISCVQIIWNLEQKIRNLESFSAKVEKSKQAQT